MKSLFSKQCVQEFLIYFTLIFYCYGFMGYIVPSPSYYPIMSWREKWPSLRVSSTGWYGNGVGKGGRACNYVSGIWIPPPIPLWLTINCQIFTNQCEAETSANVNKHWKPRAKGNYAITNIISANQHNFPSTLLMQIFKFKRPSSKLSFFFLLRHQRVPESLLEG